MRFLLLPVLWLAALPVCGQRFEAGGHAGYGGFLEEDNSGARPLYGGHFGVRVGEGRSLLFEYTQFRRENEFGTVSQHHFYGLALHAEAYPQNRIRAWVELGAGGGVRRQSYPERMNLPALSQTVAGAYGGVGAAFDVGERGFVRPGIRVYFLAPGLMLGAAPVLSVGWRF